MIFLSIKLDKTRTQPLYEQLASGIENAIVSKTVKHNDRLPTESELCQLFEVSPTVVKQAYACLRNKGLIQTLKGKGTFVHTRPFLKRNIHEYFLFHSQPNHTYYLHAKAIMIEKQKPRLSSARRVLNIADDEPTYLIKKVLFHDYFPIALGEYYFPSSLFPNLPSKPYQNIHLFDLIEEVFHHRVEAYDAAFSAGTLREDVALVLDMPKGSVAHMIRLKVLDESERVLAYAIIHVPGDYVSYEVRSYV